MVREYPAFSSCVGCTIGTRSPKRNAIAFEADHLARIVGDRPDRLEAEVEQDLRADAVLAQVGLEPELLVGLDRVGALVLQLVRLELVEQTDAAAFLIEIDDHAASLGGDHLHRLVELPAAVAAHRVEDVAGEALRVHADENVFAAGDVAVHERDVLVLVDVVLVADDPPLAVIGGQPRLGDAMHEPLVLEPVRDELRDGDERQSVLFAQTSRARAGCAVVPSSFKISHSTPAGRKPGEPREIDRGFRVADALEHAAVAGAQREDVTAVAQVARASCSGRRRREWSSRDPPR